MLVVAASWVLVLLSYLAIAGSQEVRLEHRLAVRAAQDTAMRALAKSGVSMVAALLDETSSNDWDAPVEGWDRNRVFAEVPLGDGAFAVGYAAGDPSSRASIYGAQDEERRLPLRLLDRGTFSRLQGAPLSAVDSVLARRGRLAATLTALDELSLDEKDRAFLEEHLTFFPVAGVNVNTAMPEILVALGLPAAAVAKMIGWRDGTDGAPGTADDNPFTSLLEPGGGLGRCGLSAEEAARVSDLARRGVLTVRSEFYRVRSRGWCTGTAYYEVEAVLKRAPNGASTIVDWREWPASAP